MSRWHFPLDPSCPVVLAYHQSHEEDPMSQECPCLDEIIEEWENKHRSDCLRCQNYGAANVEAKY